MFADSLPPQGDVLWSGMPSFDPAALESLDNAARRVAMIAAKAEVPMVTTKPRTLVVADATRSDTNVVEIAGFPVRAQALT